MISGMEKTKARGHSARKAARIANARRRFTKWKTEMESWGCTVAVPEDLIPPEV